MLIVCGGGAVLRQMVNYEQLYILYLDYFALYLKVVVMAEHQKQNKGWELKTVGIVQIKFKGRNESRDASLQVELGDPP